MSDLEPCKGDTGNGKIEEKCHNFWELGELYLTYQGTSKIRVFGKRQ